MSDETETHEDFLDAIAPTEDCPVCGEPMILDGDVCEDCEGDSEAIREALWRRETGSRDPQGPPIGWEPRRQRAEP